MYLKFIFVFNMISLLALCDCQCTDYYLFFEMDPTSVNILSREKIWNKMESAPNSTSFRGIDKSCVVSLECNDGLSISNCSIKRNKLNNKMTVEEKNIFDATEPNIAEVKRNDVVDNNITTRVVPVTDVTTNINDATSTTTNFTSNKQIEVTTKSLIFNATELNNNKDNSTTTITVTSTTLIANNDMVTSSTTDATNNTETGVTTANIDNTESLTEVATSTVYVIFENNTVDVLDENENMGTANRRTKKENVNKDIAIGVACFSVVLGVSALAFFVVKKLIVLMQSGTYRLPNP